MLPGVFLKIAINGFTHFNGDSLHTFNILYDRCIFNDLAAVPEEKIFLVHASDDMAVSLNATLLKTSLFYATE